MKLHELIKPNSSKLALNIEELISELSFKTNKYRELKTPKALRDLQKTQEKIVNYLKK